MKNELKKLVEEMLRDISNEDTRSSLFLGQKYFKYDKAFFGSLSAGLDNCNKNMTLNELWENTDRQKLADALTCEGAKAKCSPVFRTVMSMSWNIVISSCINVEWMTKALGEDFQLQTKLIDDAFDFFRDCGGRTLLSFGDEAHIPDKDKLNGIKRKYERTILPILAKNMLEKWGYFVVDGIESDDWMSMPLYLDEYPDGRIYIFGMTKERLESFSPDSERYIGTKIILIEESLPEVLEELDMIDDAGSEHAVFSDMVRITMPDGDALLLDRKDIDKFENMGITIMRDELMGSLFVDDSNKEQYFAEFMNQHEKKQWQYFNVRYGTEQFSFHIKRKKEEDLRHYIIGQSELQTGQRSICLLSGDSNTGKTTSLSWLAQNIYQHSPEFKGNKWQKGGYIVCYISGDPENKKRDWQKQFIEFIKKEVNGRQTEKGRKIRNNIIIWDNYETTEKKREKYFDLFRRMNECNPMLIGSIYTFENTGYFSQDTKYINVQMPSMISTNERREFESLLNKINQKWTSVLSDDPTNKKSLFKLLMDLSEFLKYSKLWMQLANSMKVRLNNESDSTEDTAFRIYQESKQYGVGSIQYQLYQLLEDDRKKRNEPMMNAITHMNQILAVAGQFNNQIDMPVELLLDMINNNDGSYIDPGKLKKILRNDSMVRYKHNVTMQNVSCVYFRDQSEALSYIENKFGSDEEKRKREEVDILLDMIDKCSWDEPVQALSVLGVVRAFGPNSYGKYRTENAKGQNIEYQDYWGEISDKLIDCARCNAEAIMVAGQLTREELTNNDLCSENSKSQILSERFKDLKTASRIPGITDRSSARLYGEMCRNIIAQMEYNPDCRENFEKNFSDGISFALKCEGFSTIQFLDIWLKYIGLIRADRRSELISRTMEYIDRLLYSDNSVHDGDYTSVINGIIQFYKMIGKKEPEDVKKHFENSANDSYVFYLANRSFITLYLEKKDTNEFTSLEEKLGYSITRFFFLNEYSSCKNPACEKEYSELKNELQTIAKDVIDILDENKKILTNSRRCLLLYLRAKWMYYTGNFILELEQRPALSDEKWKEIYDICSSLRRIQDDFPEPPAVTFISSVCEWIISKKSVWNNLRISGEKNERLLCMCSEKGAERNFRVSFYEYNGKLFATINKERIDNVWTTGTSFAQKTKIWVPDNIRNLPLNRNMKNCTTPYTLWFSLSGPILQDADTEKRGKYNV